jgi:putative phosphoribosyl transferase
MAFKNRKEAGLILARKLQRSQNWEDAIVLGLPRGGVPVALEVARILNHPLDIFTVRKLGVPGYEELAMGAVASEGTVVINEAVVREFGISQETLDAVARRERLEIERRESLYREGRPPLAIDGRSAILVDDGLATGASMLAAVRALRPRARQVIVAVPVAAKRTCVELSREVDRIICVVTPRSFMAVGMFYRHFEPTTDEEVRSLLAKAHSGQTTQAA